MQTMKHLNTTTSLNVHTHVLHLYLKKQTNYNVCLFKYIYISHTVQQDLHSCKFSPCTRLVRHKPHISAVRKTTSVRAYTVRDAFPSRKSAAKVTSWAKEEFPNKASDRSPSSPPPCQIQVPKVVCHPLIFIYCNTFMDWKPSINYKFKWPPDTKW